MSLRSIGEVVAAVSGEFPDVTVSKIRYLEGRGLLRPQRTSGGQRRYDDSDVVMIRRILRWQRDDYLPLDVIADQLARGESADGDPGIGTVPTARLRRARHREMSAEEVCQRAGVDRAMLDDLQRHGLVERLDLDAVAIARTVAALAEFGIESRHLRPFRTAADRDVALVEQALAPRRRPGGPGAVAQRREDAAGLLALLLDLHVALVRVRSTTLEI